ncbi:MAG: hypothetical protein HPY78_03860 [Brevinematales bacterium]|nr:hypothetical protein [Brevinematales bacterium]
MLSTAENLLGLFYQAPYVNGLVLFRGGEYEGVIFKRDLERMVGKPPFEVEKLIQRLSFAQVEEFLFVKEPSFHLAIPLLFLDRNEHRIILYPELRWYFHPEEFPLTKVEGILREVEHPLLICSLFKRVLYQNQKAFELFEMDILGKNVYTFLREWAIEEKEGFFVVYSEKGRFRLFISEAKTKDGDMFLFQFFPVLASSDAL